jgi:hypothetical protein
MSAFQQALALFKSYVAADDMHTRSRIKAEHIKQEQLEDMSAPPDSQPEHSPASASTFENDSRSRERSIPIMSTPLREQYLNHLNHSSGTTTVADTDVDMNGASAEQEGTACSPTTTYDTNILMTDHWQKTSASRRCKLSASNLASSSKLSTSSRALASIRPCLHPCQGLLLSVTRVRARAQLLRLFATLRCLVRQVHARAARFRSLRLPARVIGSAKSV